MEFDNTDNVANRIVDVDLANETEVNYAKYTTETIENRALPSAKDGLKPVQRRILTTMMEDRMGSKGPTHKSAKVVGAVMGRYHPHSDAAIYDALVRMAAEHVYRVPVIFGHGNFGSPQSEPAAYRYTECKLSEAGEKIVGEMSSGTTKFKPGELDKDEPVELPAQFPNLLVNGASGIAVAMSTSIPPHNLTEVLKATIFQLKHQDLWSAISEVKDDPERKLKATYKLVDKLLPIIPAPDFPTGGVIVGAKDGVREAFATGSGSILITSKMFIEAKPGGEHWITFHSLPYGVNPTKIVEKIVEAERSFIKTSQAAKELGSSKVKIEGFIIDGLTEVNDATDENGVRLVFKVKARYNPKKVAAEILSRTALETSFAYNMNALFNGSPRVASLPELLQTFINFRRSIIRSRSRHEIEQIETRLHVIDGLLKVILDIDKAYKIIRKSENQSVALDSLKTSFKLDDEQAKFILDTQLKRLTKYDSLELEKESASLHSRRDELSTILEDDGECDKVVLRELNEMVKWSKNNGFDKRLSEVADFDLTEHKAAIDSDLSANEELEAEPLTLYVVNGKVWRRKRPYSSLVKTTTLSSVIGVRRDGSAVRLQVTDLTNGAKLPDGVISLVDESSPTLTVTSRGVVAAYAPKYPAKSDTFQLISLEGDDEVVATLPLGEGYLMMVSTDAQALTVDLNAISVKNSIGGKGMAGMKLKPGATVIQAAIVSKEQLPTLILHTATEHTLKSSLVSEIPVKGRNTGGVVCHGLGRGESLVAALISTAKVKAELGTLTLDVPTVLSARSTKGQKIDGVRSFLHCEVLN